MTKKLKKAIKLLKEYSLETGTILRSTSDLSPLEEWLLNKLVKGNKIKIFDDITLKSKRELNHKFRMMLMDEGEDFGEEILVSSIVDKATKIAEQHAENKISEILKLVHKIIKIK